MRIWLSAGVLLLTSVALVAVAPRLPGQAGQVADQKAPAFDVASVKPNKSGATQVTIDVQATSVRLLNLQPPDPARLGINTPSRLARPGLGERRTLRHRRQGDSSVTEAMRPSLQALLAEVSLPPQEQRQQPIQTPESRRTTGRFGAASLDGHLRRSRRTTATEGAHPPCAARARGLADCHRRHSHAAVGPDPLDRGRPHRRGQDRVGRPLRPRDDVHARSAAAGSRRNAATRDHGQRTVALHGAAGAAWSEARAGHRKGRCPGRRARRTTD